MDSCILSAMRFFIPIRGISSSSGKVVIGEKVASEARECCLRSWMVIRPSFPVGFTVFRSIPMVRARWRVGGVARNFPEGDSDS